MHFTSRIVHMNNNKNSSQNHDNEGEKTNYPGVEKNR